MPPLASRFSEGVDRALSLAQAGEIIRTAFPRSSLVSRELSIARLEALHEMGYLRIFIAWEALLEESFLRYICGYRSPHGLPNLRQDPFKSLNDARNAMLGGANFVSWGRPTGAEQLSRRFICKGLIESVVQSSRARLEWFYWTRNRVAHRSDHSKQQFDNASMSIAGRRYRGAVPGRFLRDWNPGAVPPERWLQTIGTELKDLAAQIVP